jgi:hypothetical protein
MKQNEKIAPVEKKALSSQQSLVLKKEKEYEIITDLILL